MATIAASTKGWRHVRKTITFTGGAGAGAVGSVTVFTITGRVRVRFPSAFASTGLADAGGGTPAALSMGVTSDQYLFNEGLTPLDPADGLGTGNWWIINDNGVNTSGSQYSGAVWFIAENVILTIDNEAINSGVLVIDLEYQPITDDGALAGDDIDVAGENVGAWLGTTVATPTVAGVPEVDLTHVAGATTNVSALATNVDAILTDTADMQPKLGAVSDLGGGATIAANLADIEGQTDDIGAAGAGLSAVPWNASWDAQVQSEVTDALQAAVSELGAVPAANASIEAMLKWLFMLARNVRTQTATTETVMADDGSTPVATSTKSDSAGTFTRGEYS